MTNLEKINGLLGEVKKCPDADIYLHWPSVIELFLHLSKQDKNECATEFYKWAEDSLGQQSLKFYYAEFMLGCCYFLSEEYELALPMISKARKSFEEVGEKDGIEMSSLMTGAIYRSLGNFELALKVLLKPFDYFKQSGRYPVFLEGCCNGLGNINLEMRNYEEAFSLFNIGYGAGLKIGDDYFTIYHLQGMGKAKMLLNKPDEAKEYFNKALETAERVNFKMHIGNALNELAIFYFKTGDLDEAEKLNKESLALREEQNFIGAAVTSAINLSEIYIKQHRWDEALEILNKALAQAEQIKVKPKIYQVHLLLSKVYKGKGDIERSLYHFEIFHEVREKVQEEDSVRKLTDAKLIFEAEQTKKENVIIKKQKQEIEDKNFQLQETIDELTITKVSRKAKGITLFVGIALIVAEDPLMDFILRQIGHEQYLLSITAKVIIILSLKPIDKAIEGYMLNRLVLKKRRQALHKSQNEVVELKV